MNAAEYRAVTMFEALLVPGMYVDVRWTSGGAAYAGPATVKHANPKSVRVKLAEPVSSYPAGYEIIVPLIGDIKRWSARNRVEPRGGYPYVVTDPVGGFALSADDSDYDATPEQVAAFVALQASATPYREGVVTLVESLARQVRAAHSAALGEEL